MVRTDKRLWNAIIGCMRRAYARYSITYANVLQAARIEEVKYNKDGKPSKKPAVFYKCSVCDVKVKQKDINIDHINPVIEPGKTSYDYGLDEFLKRLDCDADNLQVICTICHDKKTAEEKALRQSLKPKKIPHKNKTQQKRTIKSVGGDIKDYVWLEKSKQYVHKSVAKGRE